MLQPTLSALIIVINHVAMFSHATQYFEFKIYSVSLVSKTIFKLLKY